MLLGSAMGNELKAKPINGFPGIIPTELTGGKFIKTTTSMYGNFTGIRNYF